MSKALEERRSLITRLLTLPLGDDEIALICRVSERTIRSDFGTMMEALGSRPSTNARERTMAYVDAALGRINGIPEHVQITIADRLEPEQGPAAPLLRQAVRMLRAGLKDDDFAGLEDNLRKCVDSLPLDIRSANGLQNAGYEFVWQVCEKTEDQLLFGTKDLGAKSVARIKTAIAGLGLSLGMNLRGFHR